MLRIVLAVTRRQLQRLDGLPNARETTHVGGQALEGTAPQGDGGGGPEGPHVAAPQSGPSRGTGLPSEAKSVVAQLKSEAAGPLQPLCRYLRCLATVAACEIVAALATPPASLPEPLPERIARLHVTVRAA
jgi:hypothetical protein